MATARCVRFAFLPIFISWTLAQQQDYHINVSYYDTSSGAALGAPFQTTYIDAGVTVWLSGQSPHDVYSTIVNNGEVVFSQTEAPGHMIGLRSSWSGDDTDGSNFLNNADSSFILNDVSSIGDTIYSWNLSTFQNSGTLQWCSRKNAANGTYGLLCNSTQCVNDGLLVFDQALFTDPMTVTLGNIEPALNFNPQIDSFTNDGAILLRNVQLNLNQDFQGNGCWVLGHDSVLYLQDGVGTYQNPNYDSPLYGQTIYFSDNSAMITIDPNVYLANSTFGAHLVGFVSENSINFNRADTSDIDYNPDTGILTVTFEGRFEDDSTKYMYIDIGLSYASDRFQYTNDEESGTSQVQYTGDSPDANPPSNCLPTSVPHCTGYNHVITSIAGYSGMSNTTSYGSGSDFGTVFVQTPTSTSASTTSTSTSSDISSTSSSPSTDSSSTSSDQSTTTTTSEDLSNTTASSTSTEYASTITSSISTALSSTTTTSSTSSEVSTSTTAITSSEESTSTTSSSTSSEESATTTSPSTSSEESTTTTSSSTSSGDSSTTMSSSTSSNESSNTAISTSGEDSSTSTASTSSGDTLSTTESSSESSSSSSPSSSSSSTTGIPTLSSSSSTESSMSSSSGVSATSTSSSSSSGTSTSSTTSPSSIGTSISSTVSLSSSVTSTSSTVSPSPSRASTSSTISPSPSMPPTLSPVASSSNYATTTSNMASSASSSSPSTGTSTSSTSTLSTASSSISTNPITTSSTSASSSSSSGSSSASPSIIITSTASVGSSTYSSSSSRTSMLIQLTSSTSSTAPSIFSTTNSSVTSILSSVSKLFSTNEKLTSSTSAWSTTTSISISSSEASTALPTKSTGESRTAITSSSRTGSSIFDTESSSQATSVLPSTSDYFTSNTVSTDTSASSVTLPTAISAATTSTTESSVTAPSSTSLSRPESSSMPSTSDSEFTSSVTTMPTCGPSAIVSPCPQCNDAILEDANGGHPYHVDCNATYTGREIEPPSLARRAPVEGTVSECLELCDITNDCVAFSFNTTDTTCSLFGCLATLIYGVDAIGFYRADLPDSIPCAQSTAFSTETITVTACRVEPQTTTVETTSVVTSCPDNVACVASDLLMLP